MTAKCAGTEYNVAMTPAGVEEMTRAGDRVLVEVGAGSGSGITDEQYAADGAEIVASTPDIWQRAELILDWFRRHLQP